MSLSKILRYLKYAKRLLRGERGRQLMGQAESAASRATGGKYDTQLRKARDQADRAINGSQRGRGDRGGGYYR